MVMSDLSQENTWHSLLKAAALMSAATTGLAATGYACSEIRLEIIRNSTVPEMISGLLAALPMILALLAVRLMPWHWSRQLWRIPMRLIGPALKASPLGSIVAIALMAGFSEELLFRGFLESWIGSWHWLAGLILPNLLFGLLHSVTPAYAICAFFAGLYFSCLQQFSSEISLLSLVTTHAFYDLIALFWIAHEAGACDFPEDR